MEHASSGGNAEVGFQMRVVVPSAWPRADLPGSPMDCRHSASRSPLVELCPGIVEDRFGRRETISTPEEIGLHAPGSP
jgi:hypothetical protein